MLTTNDTTHAAFRGNGHGLFGPRTNRTAHQFLDRPAVDDERIDAYLRRGEPMTDHTILLALEEFETCGLPRVHRDDTRAEYRRMVEHADLFFASYERSLFTAERKHVQYFVRHLSATDGATARLAAQCVHCETRRHKPGGYSPTYVKRQLAALRGFYDYALDEEIVTADPDARRGPPEGPAQAPVRAHARGDPRAHGAHGHAAQPSARAPRLLRPRAPVRAGDVALGRREYRGLWALLAAGDGHARR